MPVVSARRADGAAPSARRPGKGRGPRAALAPEAASCTGRPGSARVRSPRAVLAPDVASCTGGPVSATVRSPWAARSAGGPPATCAPPSGAGGSNQRVAPADGPPRRWRRRRPPPCGQRRPASGGRARTSGRRRTPRQTGRSGAAGDQCPVAASPFHGGGATVCGTCRLSQPYARVRMTARAHLRVDPLPERAMLLSATAVGAVRPGRDEQGNVVFRSRLGDP